MKALIARLIRSWPGPRGPARDGPGPPDPEPSHADNAPAPAPIDPPRPIAVVIDADGLDTPALPAVPISPAASDTALEQLGRGAREIDAELRTLAETFVRVGSALAESGRLMYQVGFPPDLRLLNDAANVRQAYAALHDEALHRADAFDLAPAEGTVLSLPDLVALMDRVARAEEELPRRAAALRQALAVLDRALSLRHRDPSEADLLRPCHDLAASLRGPLAEARLTEGLPHDASRLATGTHPLCTLLQLVEAAESLGDDEWARLHREVASAFSAPLASAAVRGRLVAPPAA